MKLRILGISSSLLIPLFALSAIAFPQRAGGATSQEHLLMQALETELHRAMQSFSSSAKETQPAPYFLSYAVTDNEAVNMVAQYGSIVSNQQSHRRSADVQIRVGSPALDNTHGTHRSSALVTVPLPLTEDRSAIERSLWFATNRGYGQALDNYLKVETEQQVRAKEEDLSSDFSTETAKVEELPPSLALSVDKAVWEQRLRDLSGIFRKHPEVTYNSVSLDAESKTNYFVSSENTRVSTPHSTSRLVIVGHTRAVDGMDLFRIETFDADKLSDLPDQTTLRTKTEAMAKSLEALRAAPVTEPFNGPAILSGRASAVFFHEVLGHRLEGQRQRGNEEGQTFTRLLEKPILPSFLSVADDPTLEQFHGTLLSGHYNYDDEGQPARRVELVRDGILQTFLMSRLPIASFANSNGHGRAQPGLMPTGRQGNLIVTSTKTVSDSELRQMLIEEAKKQGKPYGLYFEDISSGFAVTTRRSPQAFQVIPLVVYRVYVDGRPDELVRGVSIVGTPQTALNSILATGNHQEVFNGICGAESGQIPVSAVAPAMLVSTIETQRQAQGTVRPPILPPPPFTSSEGREP